MEREFAVVGVWEDTNITLTVFEQYIPKFFKNAKMAYFRKSQGYMLIVSHFKFLILSWQGRVF